MDYVSDQAEFNQGIAYLMRMDEILKMIDVASIEGNIGKHYRLLNTLYKELYPMLVGKTDKKTKVTDLELVKEFESMRQVVLHAINNNLARNLVGEYLDAWEKELRKVMQEKGLNMPRKDDPGYAMLGGQ